MSWRRFTITVVAVMAMSAAAVGLTGMTGMTGVARAQAGVTVGVPKEGAKVTLAETSIDGPALMTTYAPATALAWTGTDPTHHLNLMTSSDGLHYGNKITLNETSLWRPALAFIDSGRGAPYGTIVLAWTGTDPNHTLNLVFIKTPEYTVTQKITFWNELSFTAPAVATVNGDINSDVYLAWAGTDPAHTLNVIHRTTAAPVTQSKKILWGWSSVSRPNLATDHAADSLKPVLMSWTGVNNRISFAVSADGATWSQPSASPLPIQSAWAPSMIGAFTTTQPTHWLVWAGNNAGSHRIHVMYTQHFPAWSDSGAQTDLEEFAISGPALTFNGNGDTGSALVAWTGVDPQRHLNVAVLSA